ncbi:uncharacterized protein J4E92_010540 [Alternaria infectoria]|uniref:uncharacterized protein n=1 Tax=Alternaria infectoria TaxID=45303 RepID=UPI0022201B5D|nr:uncharacterized protein J4E92_010540 [Alternaria infectoria]KAI4909769.1 hypothetical protein J4E92_010540 [Alternaria infectoria]
MGERFIAGLCEDHIEEELCWDEKRELPLTEPDTRPTKWRAPTWSWACTDCPVLLSQLTKRHGGHASRQIEAECVKKHVTGKISGELESATIELKCKPVPATITELALWSSSDMVLRLFDQDGDVASRKLTHRFRRGEVQTFCEVFYLEKAKIDKESHERQSSTDGYVVLIQHCVHSQDSAMNRSPDVSENEDETDSESEEEPYEKDSAEALFLQAHGDNTFVKVGLLCFDGDRGVKQILEAHRLAEERVITLI